jgi:hypothetical protein
MALNPAHLHASYTNLYTGVILKFLLKSMYDKKHGSMSTVLSPNIQTRPVARNDCDKYQTGHLPKIYCRKFSPVQGIR